MLKGNRKMLVVIGLALVGVLVTMLKGDVPTHLSTLLGILATVFVGGNAVEHIKDLRAQLPAVQLPTVDNSELEAKVDSLQVEMNSVTQGVSQVGLAITAIMKKVGL